MTTRWMLLMIGAGGLALTAPAARSADLRPMVATPVTGTLHIVQSLPCGAPDVDVTRHPIGGRIEIAPVDGVDVGANKLFVFTRLIAFFEGFTIDRACPGLLSDHREYTEIGVRLARAVRFTGVPAGPNVYAFTIPKETFLVREAAIENATVDAAFRHPVEDVTGRINLTTGAVHVHVKVATRLRLDIGDIHDSFPGFLDANVNGILVFPDTDGDGVPDNKDNCTFTPNPDQTPVPTPVITPPPAVLLHSCLDHRIGIAFSADVCNGRAVVVTNDAPARFSVGPNTVTWTGNDGVDPPVHATQLVTVADTTPPTVSCVHAHPPGNSFLVSSGDDCSPAVIRLGAYLLTEGEVIKIEVTGRPGVRIVNDVSKDNLRHFQVGKGEDVITATDASHNVTTASCR